MADELIHKLGRNLNAATQTLSNEAAAVTHGKSDALPDAVQKLSDVFSSGKSASGAEGSTTGVALGYRAGAGVAHIYEQGFKFLFGRGQRDQNFVGNNNKVKQGQFQADETYQRKADYQHVGSRQIEPGTEGSAEAEKQRKVDARHENYRALKQDGLLGLAVKGIAAGVGNVLGAPFCGSAEAAEHLAERIDQGAHAFNSGARVLLLSVPMAAAVLTGVVVGTTADTLHAGWRGMKSLHASIQRGTEKRRLAKAEKKKAEQAKAAKAEETKTDKAADPVSPHATDKTKPEETKTEKADERAAPETTAPEHTETAKPETHKATETHAASEPGSTTQALATLRSMVGQLHDGLQENEWPTVLDLSKWKSISADEAKAFRAKLAQDVPQTLLSTFTPEQRSTIAALHFYLAQASA